MWKTPAGTLRVCEHRATGSIRLGQTLSRSYPVDPSWETNRSRGRCCLCCCFLDSRRQRGPLLGKNLASTALKTHIEYIEASQVRCHSGRSQLTARKMLQSPTKKSDEHRTPSTRNQNLKPVARKPKARPLGQFRSHPELPRLQM